MGTDGIVESNTPSSYPILFVEVQRIEVEVCPTGYMILELSVPRYDILTEHVNLFVFSIDRRAFDFLSRNNRESMSLDSWNFVLHIHVEIDYQFICLRRWVRRKVEIHAARVLV